MERASVFFTELSKADYDALAPTLREECAALLKKLQRAGKRLGMPLENKNDKDLTGYYKLYFDEARHRVVYTEIAGQIEVAAIDGTLKETLEITGIGKRERQYIYELIQQRISDKEKAHNE